MADGLCLRSALPQLTVHLCLTLRSTHWQCHRVCFGVYSPPPTAELTQVNVCLAVTLPSVRHSWYPHYSWASQALSEEPSFYLLISFCNIIQESYFYNKKSPFFSGTKMEIRKASVWSKLNRRQVAEVGMHAQAGQSDVYRNSLSLSPWLRPSYLCLM